MCRNCDAVLNEFASLRICGWDEEPPTPICRKEDQ